MKTASLGCLAFFSLSFLAAPYLRGSELPRYLFEPEPIVHWPA